MCRWSLPAALFALDLFFRTHFVQGNVSLTLRCWLWNVFATMFVLNQEQVYFQSNFMRIYNHLNIFAHQIFKNICFRFLPLICTAVTNKSASTRRNIFQFLEQILHVWPLYILEVTLHCAAKIIQGKFLTKGHDMTWGRKCSWNAFELGLGIRRIRSVNLWLIYNLPNNFRKEVSQFKKH